jgi:two-component system chemotaxis sensor kinase CheA
MSCSMAAYALFGAAAVHPSSAAFAQPVVRPRASLSPLLLAGLTAASLVAPAILAVQVARHEVTDGGAIALCATILFLLVVARMSQLVRRVEERTRELAERNRAVRLVLDTVNEGLLRVSREGNLLLERSAMIDRWFSPFDKPTPFADYFRPLDEHFAVAFQLGYEALLEDVLPAELCLAQLPPRLRCKGRDYKVSYLPVLDGERQDGLLVVFEDVTEQLLRAQQDAEQRELLAMFQALTRDKVGFLSFFDEASRLIEQLSAGSADLATQKRRVHTLKGNASMASLDLVVQLCNDVEDAIEANGALPTAAIDALHARWRALADAFRVLVGEQGRDVIAVSAREVDDLCAEIDRGLPSERVVERLSAWRDEPVERPLERLANYARALAGRLGKGELVVDVDGNGVRLDPEHWAPLWAELVHVVRNAVDHGLESPEERQAAGKEGQPRLRLAVSTADSKLIVEIEDDGRGIDWDAIRRAAKDRGMPGETAGELTAALLAPGVSARQDVGQSPEGRHETERLSGRGIGMAAVATRVEQLGGKIELVSRTGKGTTWRFTFPPSSLARQKTAILPGEVRSA